MPKISVVIPIYGVEKFIARCARSLFEQTLDDIEFLFVDDCTPDHSVEILKDVLEQFPYRKKQTRIVKMPTNSGLPAVRRHGIQLATGDYIIHCDSDDWVDVTMYEKMYAKAISGNHDIVFCDYYTTDGVDMMCHSCHSECTKKQVLSNLISQRIAVAVWNKLVRRELYFHSDIIYPIHNMGEDLALSIQLAVHANNFGYISEPLYYYYLNLNSITRQDSVKSFERRWNDLYNNTLLVVEVLQQVGLAACYKDEIYTLKQNCRNNTLLHVTHVDKFRKLWLDAFPELTLMKEDGLKAKLRHLMVWLGVYPITYKMRGLDDRRKQFRKSI